MFDCRGKKFGEANLSGAPVLNFNGLVRFFKTTGLWSNALEAQSPAPADANGLKPPVPSIQHQQPQPPLPPGPQGGSAVPASVKEENRRSPIASSAVLQPASSAPHAAAAAKEGKKQKTSTSPPLPSILSTTTPRSALSQPAQVGTNGVPATTGRKTSSSQATVTAPQAAATLPVTKPTAPPLDHKTQVHPQVTTVASPNVPVVAPAPTKPFVPIAPTPTPTLPKPISTIPVPAPPIAVPVKDALSAKAQDPSRPQDAASSPASSVPSATTPAVQDFTATTSHEKEDSQPTPKDKKLDVDRDEVMVDVPSVEVGRKPSSGAESHPPPAPAAPAQRGQVAVPQRSESHPKPTSQPTVPLPFTVQPPAPKPTVSQPEPPATTLQTEPAPKPSTPVPPISAAQPTPSLTVDAKTPPPGPPKTEPQDAQAPAEPMDVDKPVADDAQKPVGSTSSTAEPKPAKQPTTPRPVESSQTQKPPQISQPPQPERAVTRVSSGAIRQKSVAEILGGSLATPRPSAAEKSGSTPRSAHGYPTTPSTSRSRSQLQKRKERERKQVSTVVFGKQPKRHDDKSVGNSKHQEPSPENDYFTPLFIEGFVQRSSWMKPLGALLNQAHKTISSSDAMLAYEDDQACKVLKRVYLLQHTNKWSLRQRERCPEPTRPPSHNDVLMQEMKWMRTDFREERKWKMAMARILANACMKWHAASPEERIALQVSAVPPPKEPVEKEVDMVEAGLVTEEAERTPELSRSDPSESGLDDELDIISPSAIFALPEDQVVFPLRQSPTSDLLLSELPLYGSPLKEPSSDMIQPDYDPDVSWRQPALPLSRYVQGDMRLVTDGQPTWQSKFLFDEESEDEDGTDKYKPGAASSTSHRDWLPPEKTGVALFNPEMKPIKDRLHASHQFRPPSEHPMPPQSFYENRVASQWTAAEDEELRNLVSQYSYNWSLISDILSPRSAFSSGAERRTAWECFERWLQLEPLSPDLAKMQYFRAYNHRIENAQRVVMQQYQTAQQLTAAKGQPPPKRRQCVPVRVEKRHNRRHINMIGAMMKVAKKREATAQKQQAQATMIAMRKANESSQQQQQRPQPPVKTPRDYSIMRWERDQALAEKMAQYAQRHEAQKRVCRRQLS